MLNRSKKRSSANAKNSARIHTVRNSISFHPTPLAKKIIFTIIIVASISVFTAIFLSYYLTNEHLTKSRINELADDYYKNFFYQSLSADIPKEQLPTTLEKYSTTGFSIVTLRQLLIHNDKYSDFLLSHCNENSTYVKFYPVTPYSQDSYRTEFTYSCDF